MKTNQKLHTALSLLTLALLTSSTVPRTEDLLTQPVTTPNTFLGFSLRRKANNNKKQTKNKHGFHDNWTYNCRYRYHDNSWASGCRECDDGYYRFESAWNVYACAPCPNGCAECQNNKSCIKCKSNFFRSPTGTQCLACSEGCAKCTSEQHCNECENYFFKQEKNNRIFCSACSQNCKTCLNAQTCTQCDDTHFVNEVKACEKCPENCTACTARTNCTKCSFNYEVKGGLCVLKPLGQRILNYLLIAGAAIAACLAGVFCCRYCCGDNPNSQRGRNSNTWVNNGQNQGYNQMGNEMGPYNGGYAPGGAGFNNGGFNNNPPGFNNNAAGFNNNNGFNNGGGVMPGPGMGQGPGINQNYPSV